MDGPAWKVNLTPFPSTRHEDYVDREDLADVVLASVETGVLTQRYLHISASAKNCRSQNAALRTKDLSNSAPWQALSQCLKYR